MYNYDEDINFDWVLPDVKMSNREQALKHCVDVISEKSALPASLLLQGLTEKRRMDRACLGNGLAIFDMKLQGINRPVTLLAKFPRSFECNAPDGISVNLLCMIISPQNEGALHLRRLSRLSRLLGNKEIRRKLTEAADEEEMRAVLMNPDGWMMAA